jgi:hypothetical protein
VAPEPVPKAVPGEVPAEGGMTAACTPTPSPSHGAPMSSLPSPCIATAMGAASNTGLEVVLGHPAPYVLGDVPLDEAMSTPHRAMSQVQCVLRREGGDLADECRRLQLWASMLKRTRSRRGRRCGHDSMALTYRCRPSPDTTSTPSSPLLMRRSCTHRLRLRSAPSSS